MRPAPAPARHPALGAFAALTAAALFAVNGTMSKIAMEAGLSSLRLVALRSVGAAACLFALVAVLRPHALRTTRSEITFLAVYGITGIAFVQWFYFVAIARLPVGIALLLEYTAPLLVALWVRFVRHEAVRPRVWGALVLCLAGLGLVSEAWAGLTLDGIGVLAALAAAVALATYYLMGERGLGSRDALSLSAWTFGFSGLLWSLVQPWWSFPVPLLAMDVALPGPLAGTTVPLWLLAAVIVVLGTVAPFLLVLAAIGHIGATRVGLIGMSEPVGAGLVAWIVLEEVLSGPQLVGGAVVLVGIVLAETARRRPPSPGEAAPPLPEGVAP
jgi:drug/metabolite transporter (DMT)-like permease